ncbi:MAG: ABC transporter ATP-binding protein [Selenomonadaceae bacterium]|uniref:ABC transporter ATP-binding protein n=1 Tax=Anaerovibrio slackiae TaxID=2652309 RepID=A0A6I2UL47_9FIRM|nr:ABC transporter ATP-binding protein [Anaerovibrio slackiae]MBQ2010936.1 ABC transporter ATP-binding protein [Selenomonadaceae bacterium]MBQ2411216.1 ABC transporter ATP-binding protein [Selenomonadaceae bacterium]MBQ5733587.1 ABC transporter ATP-binding protein [Selenomonadaceae bacterium]MBQ5821953.1 ABC transporter ATP-binding protein [Selenomonadaceae bacterium]MBQ5845084.1 ABC transporter ATP-binding protein [Selenomonadaceae bacterium]
MSVEININKVVKKYGDLTIIPGLDEHIKNGEFFTLLGPSGCGKTTLLRMIAGFNSIEGGTIAFNDKVINDIPAHERNIGMVFQSYAIFPHLTVRENVEYGLKLRKMPKDEMKRKVDDILDVVQITEYQDRLPERLSGGQQQRVALARAIVIHPSVLLMDEPLSNLDAKLRVEMRSAIREVQKQVGITTVYVTHDQEEALSISDRIAVMKKGVIQQTASPHTIYTRPYNVFVSTFIGHSNLFHATVRADGSGKAVVFNDGYVMPMDNLSDEVTDGMQVIVSVRPEEFSIQPQGQGLQCRIKNKVFLGKYNTYFLDFEEKMLVPNQPSIEFSQDLGHAERLLDVNETVTLKPNAAKVNVFTADGERNLLKGVVLHE